jgi:valyl-tRNA synthetase
MRLLHPFMPFITEEIWQHLPHQGDSLIVASWPEAKAEFENPAAVKQMELLMDIIRSVRNIRAEVNVPMSKKIELLIKANDEEVLLYLESGKAYIERFCNPEVLQVATDLPAPEKAMSAVVSGAELYLPLAGLIDIEQEIARLEKELKVLDAEVERVQKKLSNKGFVDKAPAHVIEQERAKEADYLDKQAKVKARIAELKG